MIKSKNNFFKRFIASFLVIISLMTFANFSGVADFAMEVYANTTSGQIDISNGSSYGVSWNYIYGTNQIDMYNRSLAVGKTYDSTNTTNMLKKYVVSGGGKDQVNANNTAVPIYRISRIGGYTTPDVGATIKSLGAISIDSGSKLRESTKNSKGNYILTESQANMIAKVMYYGLPQFTATSGSTLTKQNCYFMATQAIIWEIQEGKRTGWGNSTAYTNTASSNYAANASAKNRGTMANSYNSARSASYKYYWHDWYYTQYNKYFASSGVPDYYAQILANCSNYGSNITFSTASERISGTANKFTASSAKAGYYESTWNKNAYEFSFTLNGNCTIGRGIGQYNINNLTVQYYNSNSKTWPTLSTSKYSCSVSNQTVTLKFTEKSNKIYRLVWKPNTYSTNYYNQASALRTSGGTDGNARGYVNCGAVTYVPPMYLKIHTSVCTVKYVCGYDQEALGTEIVPKSSTPSSVPNHTGSTHGNVESQGWYVGSKKIGDDSNVKSYKITTNTTFIKKFNDVYNLDVYCAYCGELITSKSGTNGTSVNLPTDSVIADHFKTHTIPDYYSSIVSNGKYYTEKEQTNAISQGNGTAIKLDSNKVYYAGYECNANIQFICDANEFINNYNLENNSNIKSCDKNSTISSEEISIGTVYSVPEAHNHENCLGEDKTVYFVGWAEKVSDGITYEYDENGNIKYDEDGNPIIENETWHYENFIPSSQTEITVNKNTTYYAVYTETGNVNITVELIDINEFTNNGCSFDDLNTIKEKTIEYPINVLNNDTHTLENNYANIKKDFNLTEVYIPENTLFENEKITYSWTKQYFTSNNDSLISSASELNNVDSLDNDIFTNHLVANDEVIYLFYDSPKKDLPEATINVIVAAESSDYLKSYIKNENEAVVTNEYIKGSMYYGNENSYDWDGISTKEIVLNNYGTMTEEQAVAYLSQDYKTYTKYVSYSFTYKAKSMTELAEMLNNSLKVTVSLTDENGYCDYSLVNEQNKNILNGQTVNIIFIAEPSFKVKYQFVDENGNPIENCSVDTLINPDLINEIHNASDDAFWESIFESNLTSSALIEKVYKKTIKKFQTIDAKNETESNDSFAHETSDKTGCTKFVLIPESEPKPVTVWGRNWLVSFIDSVSYDYNYQTYFDMEFYCSGLYSGDNYDNYEKFDPLLNNDQDFLLNEYVGGKSNGNYPYNTLINNFKNRDTDKPIGDVLVKIIIKETYPPVTVNIHFSEDFNFRNSNDEWYTENPSIPSFDLNVTNAEDNEKLDCSKTIENASMEYVPKYKEGKNYPYLVTTQIDLDSSYKDVFISLDNINSRVFEEDGTEVFDAEIFSDIEPYKNKISERVVDIYVTRKRIPVPEIVTEQLMVDFLNNSSKTEAELGITSALKPSVSSGTYLNVSFGKSNNLTTFKYLGAFDKNDDYSPINNDKRYVTTSSKYLSPNPLGNFKNEFQDLKLSTKLSETDVYANAKCYTPYMLYKYIKNNCSDITKLQNPNISNEEALELLYQTFNVEENNKEYFKTHVDELIYFANYQKYITKVDVATYTYKNKETYNGRFDLGQTVSLYNDVFKNHTVDNKVYNVVAELAKMGYDFGKDDCSYIENGCYNFDLAYGLTNDIELSTSTGIAGLKENAILKTIYDSYYYVLIEIEDVPTITFDINLPEDSFKNSSVKLNDTVTIFGRTTSSFAKTNKYKFSAYDFYKTTSQLNVKPCFKPLGLEDIFDIETNSNENKQDVLYDLNKKGVLYQTSNNGKTTDSYSYKAVGWGSSEDTHLSKRILKLYSENDSTEENYNYLTGVCTAYDSAGFYKSIKTLLDEVAESDGKGNYTLYLNWIGMPTVETYSTKYDLEQIKTVQFASENVASNDILNSTTKFNASVKQNGNDINNLTALRKYKSQENFDKQLKSNITGDTDKAGFEFVKGHIGSTEYDTLDAYLQALKTLDKEYLKTYGEPDRDDNGNIIEGKYRIACTYDIYYWDDNLADSFTWENNGTIYKVPLNAPKQYAEAITFWVVEDLGTETENEIRYISLKYFEDEDQKLIPREDGGLKEDSKWRNDKNLRLKLRNTLTNSEDENGVWTTAPKYEFTISESELKEVRDYISSYTDENGIDSYCDDTMLNHIYQNYIDN